MEELHFQRMKQLLEMEQQRKNLKAQGVEFDTADETSGFDRKCFDARKFFFYLFFILW